MFMPDLSTRLNTKTIFDLYPRGAITLICGGTRLQVHSLFDAVYWSSQLRVFQHLKSLLFSKLVLYFHYHGEMCLHSLNMDIKTCKSTTHPSIRDVCGAMVLAFDFIAAMGEVSSHKSLWLGEASFCLFQISFDSRNRYPHLRHLIMMAESKTAVTPLLMHWSYCSLALSHRYVPWECMGW